MRGVGTGRLPDASPLSQFSVESADGLSRRVSVNHCPSPGGRIARAKRKSDIRPRRKVHLQAFYLTAGDTFDQNSHRHILAILRRPACSVPGADGPIEFLRWMDRFLTTGKHGPD